MVLDSGFGSNPGENDILYRRRKEMAEIALSADCDGKTSLCECPHIMLIHQWDEYCSFGERKRISHEE